MGVGGTKLALLVVVRCVCLKLQLQDDFKTTGEAFHSFFGERFGWHKPSHNGFL